MSVLLITFVHVALYSTVELLLLPSNIFFDEDVTV